ncbi:acyltransferase family protein [Bradyrhizobium guangdongense]
MNILETASQKPQQNLGFVPRLESLRGLAAVSIVAYHGVNGFYDTKATGLSAVILFFVLSGFVLARSLTKNRNPVEFVRARLFRLYPAAISTVLLFTFLHFQFGLYDGRDFSAVNVSMNALMLRSDINGPMWSMTVEIVAIPVVLVAFWMCEHFGPRSTIPVIAILFGLSFSGEYSKLLGGVTNLAPLYGFVVGLALHFAGPLMVESFGSRRGLAAVLACSVLLICGVRGQPPLIVFVEIAASGVLISLVAFDPQSRLFAFLDLRPVRFIGRISYSFYLLHMIGLALALHVVTIQDAPLLSVVLGSILGIFFTIPMAWLSWRFVEVPFIERRKRSPRFRPASNSAPA